MDVEESKKVVQRAGFCGRVLVLKELMVDR